MKYIFGPVASRRLGRSLGIDLVPYKTCSFDCLYCELGTTTTRTLERKEYIPAREILDELKQYLKDPTHHPDYITLGGSGEPTLHSKINEIILEIKKLTTIPVAVLTNGSVLYLNEVNQALLPADLILPSLDTALPSTFKYLNRPHPDLELEKIIQGLIDFRKVFKGKILLEILFCLGVNDSQEEIKRLQEAIAKINPDKIQVNTLDRPPAIDIVLPLNQEQMTSIKQIFGDKAEIISGANFNNTQELITNQKRRVHDLLKRRPCPLDEVSRVLGIPEKELTDLIEELRSEEKVSHRLFNNQRYYQGH